MYTPDLTHPRSQFVVASFLWSISALPVVNKLLFIFQEKIIPINWYLRRRIVCVCICASVVRGELVFVPPQIPRSWRQPEAPLLHAQTLEGQPQGVPEGSVGEAQPSVNQECVKLLSQTLQSPDTQAPKREVSVGATSK